MSSSNAASACLARRPGEKESADSFIGRERERERYRLIVLSGVRSHLLELLRQVLDRLFHDLVAQKSASSCQLSFPKIQIVLVLVPSVSWQIAVYMREWHRKKEAVNTPFLCYKRSFYQDRLGTDIGKVEKRGRFRRTGFMASGGMTDWLSTRSMSCEKKHRVSLFECFPYVCPEPVLVK